MLSKAWVRSKISLSESLLRGIFDYPWRDVEHRGEHFGVWWQVGRRIQLVWDWEAGYCGCSGSDGHCGHVFGPEWRGEDEAGYEDGEELVWEAHDEAVQREPKQVFVGREAAVARLACPVVELVDCLEGVLGGFELLELDQDGDEPGEHVFVFGCHCGLGVVVLEAGD